MMKLINIQDYNNCKEEDTMEKYIDAEMQIVSFDSKDIITTSLAYDEDDLPVIGPEF